MRTEFKRREFLAACVQAGVACCALSLGPGAFAQDPVSDQKKKPDPTTLEYCGYKCPADCPLKKGTAEKNTELLKKGYTEFKLKEKYDIEFDPEKVFCYGCKTKDKPLSITVKSCTVRKCVIEKGYECCIQCSGLATCEKELWSTFPTFKEHVIALQKEYLKG